MRRVAFAIALFALTCHTAAQQPDPKRKTDLELIQGAWWIVGLESNGKKQPEKAHSGHTFTFRKDKEKKGVDVAELKESSPYPPVEFTYSLDQSRMPRAIDLTTKGNTARGIYKLDGDDLTICVSLVGPRPTEFATKTGSDTETFTLRRNRLEKYTDKAFGFTVDFPGKPVESKHPAEIAGGKATATVYTAHNDAEHITYSVAVTPLPGRFDTREAEAVLEAAQKAALAGIDKSANAKIDSDGRPFKPPGGGGGVSATREFTLATTLADGKEKGAMRVRLYVAGDRLYAQSVAGPEEATRGPWAGQFFGSFRVPAGKGKGPTSKQ
jgi:uncharacterized protein (TIGR03067 family)